MLQSVNNSFTVFVERNTCYTYQPVSKTSKPCYVVIDVDSKSWGVLQLSGHLNIDGDNLKDISAAIENSMLVCDDRMLRVSRNVELAEYLVHWEKIDRGHNLSKTYDSHAHAALDRLRLNVD